MIRQPLAFIAALAACTVAWAEGVTVARGDGHWLARADHYRARVDEDGCMSSLRIDGLEFLSSKPSSLPRGACLYLGGLLRSKEVSAAGPTASRRRSSRACPSSAPN